MKQPSDTTRFLSALKQIVSVPKAEIDRREAEYRKQRKAKRDAKTA